FMYSFHFTSRSINVPPASRQLLAKIAATPDAHSNWPYRDHLIASVVSIASLLPLPEWTKRAILAMWIVQPLFLRAAHVAIAHRHRIDTVLVEEIFHFLLDLWVGRDIRGAPTLDDRLCTVMKNHAGSHLCRRLVVGAVQGHGADGVFRGFFCSLVL